MMNKIDNDLGVASYERGQWEMLKLISSVYHGEDCYFIQDDGTVYSRISSSTLANIDEAANEFLDYIVDELY